MITIVSGIISLICVGIMLTVVCGQEVTGWRNWIIIFLASVACILAAFTPTFL